MMDTVRWSPAVKGQLLPGKLRMINQVLLPEQLVYMETDDAEEIFDAIKTLVVRGAPAIGCAAALGLAAASQHSVAKTGPEFLADVRRIAARLAQSRPTAVNLFWALDKCVAKVESAKDMPAERLKLVLLEAGLAILDEDIAMCKAIGQHGAGLIKDGDGVLTHCNAGALATGDYGTALSPVYVAKERGLRVRVYSDETRPLLQGSRLTAWELKRAGVEVTTICDNMAAQVMREGKVQLVIVGADRIAANGDFANKIGTYGVAVLAKHHSIPFYVAAPYSTIDPGLADGSGIPIEMRDPDEVRRGFGRLTAPPDVDVYNPAFDVTPHGLVAGIITQSGILRPPYVESIRDLLQGR